MRKIRIVQSVGILLILIYGVLLVVDLIYDNLGDYRTILLSLLLAGIAVNMIVKGVIIKSGSTMWFALTLTLSAIAVIILEIRGIGLEAHYYIFAILPIISSFINLAIFENLIYIKVVIINISILIPILLEYFVEMGIYWTIAIGIVSVIFGLIICRMMKINKENV